MDYGYSIEGNEVPVMEREEGAEVDERLEKARKRSRDYARRKRKELLFVKEKALIIYNELVQLGAYSRLSPSAREFFDVYKYRELRASYPYPPNMYKMFGKLIAPGAQVTLREAMARLYKGKNEINFLVRGWERKHGVHIDIIEAENGVALDAIYRIDRVDPIQHGDNVRDAKEIMSGKERSSFRQFESTRD